MSDDHGKWNFNSDEERRMAIEAEADAQASIADSNASATSKWWIVCIVFVVVLGGVQAAGMLTGLKPAPLVSLVFKTGGDKDK